MALTPIALIPQVVLGGRMVPMTNKTWLEYVMAVVPSRWSFEGLLAAERLRARATPWKIKACITSGHGDRRRQASTARWRSCSNATQGAGGLGFTTYDQPLVAFGVLGGMTLRGRRRW